MDTCSELTGRVRVIEMQAIVADLVEIVDSLAQADSPVRALASLEGHRSAEAHHGKLPEGFEKDVPTPPPPPVDENEILDLSIDLNAVSIDAEIPLNELEDSGIERVPMADPGMDVSLHSLSDAPYNG